MKALKALKRKIQERQRKESESPHIDIIYSNDALLLLGSRQSIDRDFLYSQNVLIRWDPSLDTLEYTETRAWISLAIAEAKVGDAPELAPLGSASTEHFSSFFPNLQETSEAGKLKTLEYLRVHRASAFNEKHKLEITNNSNNFTPEMLVQYAKFLTDLDAIFQKSADQTTMDDFSDLYNVLGFIHQSGGRGSTTYSSHFLLSWHWLIKTTYPMPSLPRGGSPLRMISLS